MIIIGIKFSKFLHFFSATNLFSKTKLHNITKIKEYAIVY